jgi:hypothetical protein
MEITFTQLNRLTTCLEQASKTDTFSTCKVLRSIVLTRAPAPVPEEGRACGLDHHDSAFAFRLT